MKKKYKKRIRKKKKGIPAEVKRIMNDHNLTIQTSFLVYKGKLDIDQAIQKEIDKQERKEKAEELCKKYKDLKFSEACSIVKDNITPEEYVAKKKDQEKRQRKKELNKKVKFRKDPLQISAYKQLETYRQKKVPIILGRPQLTFQKGILKNFTPYIFYFLNKNNKKEYKIHRLKIKYFYLEKDHEFFQKWIMKDSITQKKKLTVRSKLVEDYKVSDKILINGAEVMLALYEGEIIRGIVVWSTPYDIMLKSKDAYIWIFQHSIIDSALLRKP